ncbi:Vms1/Ankzf1 family peptidyl-tRNA hydrolase [Sinomonas sp. JGH33]|uniref:Vms1/Ankzf1 family peptidyl-tRNA hydrolase n=1 Tax=Sinomonas terricola TaxID=3110330 RepID=A0ABU5T5J7_9MICC|nr:Vms1/Ankzf1 family peptidyl-tRNA hydrolase [Sinomonas sp. JGH33]MEA5454950.1 Vms1/Ankzf1 family peptidyl-tRNA hydrolase [Sinomonas sp. JGH33]
MRALADLAELLRDPGPWCTVHAEVSTGTVTALEATDVLGQNVSRALGQAGASQDDVRAAERLDWPAEGIGGPVSRFVLIRAGEVVVNELVPGIPRALVAEAGPIANLIPLATVRGADVDYLVVEAERADAEIRRHRASAFGPADRRELHGETDTLTKVPLGGYSQGKYQHRTEEIWRRNGAEVAAEVNRLVEDGGVQLVVLAGDERARLKVQDALSERAAGLVQTVGINAVAGADRARFEQEVDALVAGVAARRQRETLERLVAGLGSYAAGGWAETVRALQEARVETLLLSPEAAEGRTLLALDAEPWVAQDESESLGVPVLGPAAAAPALLRAAVLTRADTVLFPLGALDGGEAAAALLRW